MAKKSFKFGPGPEFDRIVTEKVMGFVEGGPDRMTEGENPGIWFQPHELTGKSGGVLIGIPYIANEASRELGKDEPVLWSHQWHPFKPSTDTLAAQVIAEKFPSYVFEKIYHNKGKPKYRVSLFHSAGSRSSTQSTLPFAISTAAYLLAERIDIWRKLSK